jgi:hypothetical protein
MYRAELALHVCVWLINDYTDEALQLYGTDTKFISILRNPRNAES